MATSSGEFGARRLFRVLRRRTRNYVHSNWPILRIVSRLGIKAGVAMLTWIARSTVGTHTVAGHILNEVLQRPLVARLLALVQDRGHAVVLARCDTRDLREGAEREPRTCAARSEGGQEGATESAKRVVKAPIARTQQPNLSAKSGIHDGSKSKRVRLPSGLTADKVG